MRQLSFALALLLLGADAQANIAQSRPRPAVFAGPKLDAAQSALRVESEQLELDCRDSRSEPFCRFTASYRFHNPTSVRQVALAAFYGVRASELEIVQDGRAAGKSLSPVQAKDLDASLGYRGWDQVTRAGMEIAVEAGRTALVTVRGRMDPGRYFSPSYALPVPRSRHMLLGGRPERSNLFHLDYLIAPIRTWGRAPAIALTVRHPAGWDLSLYCQPRSSEAAPPASSPSTASAATASAPTPPPARRRMPPKRPAASSACPVASRAYEGSEVVQKLTIAGEAVDTLNLVIKLPRRVLWNGGILAGIGGNLDDSGGLRARFGYEIAAPEWLLISLSVDTNFKDDVVLAPMLEAATPSVLIFPSLGLGLGLPIRLVEERRVGVRVQLTMHWPILGWVTSFDIYPGQGFSEPRRFQVSMLAQIGL